MRRYRSADLLPFNPEIERTLRQLRRENREREEVPQVEMANDENNRALAASRALRDYTVPIVAGSAIRRPAIQANNFELKPSLTQMVQSN